MVNEVRGRAQFLELVQNQCLKVNCLEAKLIPGSLAHVAQMHKAALWQKFREETGAAFDRCEDVPRLDGTPLCCFPCSRFSGVLSVNALFSTGIHKRSASMWAWLRISSVRRPG